MGQTGLLVRTSIEDCGACWDWPPSLVGEAGCRPCGKAEQKPPQSICSSRASSDAVVANCSTKASLGTANKWLEASVIFSAKMEV